MRAQLSIFILIFSITACRNNDAYNPNVYLSKQQQDTLIYKTLRYAAKLAPTATHATKFNTAFDPYYKNVFVDYDLRNFYPTADSNNFFLMTRKARSITPMRESIGGKIKINKEGEVIAYEEIFRTWKMPDEALKTKGTELFDAMVQGKDLTQYYSKYKGDQYIEFPDDRFYFDKYERRWHDRELDSLNIN